MTDKCLDEMLLSGEIECLMSSLPPKSFYDGHPDVVRLIPDFEAVETAHYERTGIFPIMHTIAIKRDLTDRYP